MKPRLLPILSVVCLASAWVLIMGYAFDVELGFPLTPGGTVFGGVVEQHGTAVLGYVMATTQPATHEFSLDRRPLRLRTLAIALIRFDFRKIAATAAYGPGYRVDFPLWLLILPLLIPPLFWWRRCRRERANVPGFPVEAAPSEKGNLISN